MTLYTKSCCVVPPRTRVARRHDSEGNELLGDKLDERTDDAVEPIMQGAILIDVA